MAGTYYADFVMQNKKVWSICSFIAVLVGVCGVVMNDCRVSNPVVEWDDVVNWSVINFTGSIACGRTCADFVWVPRFITCEN